MFCFILSFAFLPFLCVFQMVGYAGIWMNGYTFKGGTLLFLFLSFFSLGVNSERKEFALL